MTKLYEALKNVPGASRLLWAAGEETRLLDELSLQLPGKVLRLTTTRIHPPQCPCLINPRVSEMRQAFEEERVLCIASLLRSATSWQCQKCLWSRYWIWQTMCWWKRTALMGSR